MTSAMGGGTASDIGTCGACIPAATSGIWHGMNGTDPARRSLVRVHQGWLGISLMCGCWLLNWTLPGTRTAYLFFPLWLGFILTVDTLVLCRAGTSLWTRSHRDFALLFVASAPGWWLFEALNQRTGNWQYLGTECFSDLEYFILCTVSFSTVMPAVFETAELVRTFHWVDRFAKGPRVPRTPGLRVKLLMAGVLMLGLLLAWPRFFYPFLWLSLVLILEPVNGWLGRRQLLDDLQQGNWRPAIALSTGALICGCFWEMWNYYSFPKWIYHTPGVEFLHVFEMPLLGYGGYIPFALELFALRSLLFAKAPPLRL